MQRVDTPEILDSETCPPQEVCTSLQDLCRINRWFGGVSTTEALLARVASVTGQKRFSLLEVASGFGDVPKIAARRLGRRGISVNITLLDRVPSHLRQNKSSLVGDALALPFRDTTFDVVSCNLFAHHLAPCDLARFAKEAVRVSRHALVINDLVRHPMHLALVYAAFPLMRSRVSRLDGVASVRRAYVPEEVRNILSSAFPSQCAPQVEIFRHFLFRMGVIVWKQVVETPPV
jgi:hypothetical protein